jgi:hypothetical protein
MPLTRTPTHGYAASREAAMTAFAKSWRRESAARGKPSRQLGKRWPPPAPIPRSLLHRALSNLIFSAPREGVRAPLQASSAPSSPLCLCHVLITRVFRKRSFEGITADATDARRDLGRRGLQGLKTRLHLFPHKRVG